MLTWINEKAKWIIVIFAAGIVVGLLAMDRVPKTAQSYPMGVVNDKKISYADFDARMKMIIQNQYQGQHIEDEQYAALRAEILRGFVREILLKEQFEKSGLAASVAEMKAEFKSNPDAVRGRLVQEAQRTIYVIQQQASSDEERMQRIQSYMATLPSFIVDTTFNKADYDAWLETPEAFNWYVMLQIEEELKTGVIPNKQLQFLVNASIHSTSFEAKWSAARRLAEYDFDIAVAAGSDFAVAPDAITDEMVKEYYNANPDSFYVSDDKVQFKYAVLPIAPTAADEAAILDYAKTIYASLKDSTSTTTFEELARNNSEDKGTAENGGKLSQKAGEGIFVPEFEAVALALDSGAISEPVKTKYGYHIIKSYGKSTDSTGKVTADVGHILLSLTATSETIDSLERVLTSIKSDVENGKSFESAALERGITLQESNWVGHDGIINGLGYLRGLSSFAWPNENVPEDGGVISNVLKNDKWVAIVAKAGEFKAGVRELQPNVDAIKATLLAKKSSEAAAAYLATVADQIKAWAPAADSSAAAPAIEKVSIESKSASVDGYIPGFGYGNPEAAKVLASQTVGEWSAPIATAQGAVMIKVKGKKEVSEADINTAARDEAVSAARFAGMSLYNMFIGNIVKGTPYVSNLDLFYRD